MTTPPFSRHLQHLFQRSTTITHLLQIHSIIFKTALDNDPLVIATFISSSFSISIDYARSFFDRLSIPPPLFIWNSMIREYAKSPHPSESVALFSDLRKVGHAPDNFTYPFVLKACARSSMLGEGGIVHCVVLKAGFRSDSYVRNTLLHMYATCGAIEFARRVFDEMPERDVVSWSAMIGGYITCNCPLEAFKVFQQMMAENEKPNSITLVSLLSACTHLGSLRIGESIHSYAIVNALKLDVALGTALVEMYAKCGDIQKAHQIFISMSIKNLQSWTVMISGLADHGRGKDALTLFSCMEMSGLKPDGVSFSAILCACSHLGLVNEGRQYFDRMVSVYKIQPTMEHYGCMVDLFGRAGLVEEAYGVIRCMPMEPNSVILRSFMCACRNHGWVLHVDESLMKLLLAIEPDLGSNYVLAANMSAVSGHWDNVAHLRRTMAQKGLKKVPGCSWVEVNGTMRSEG
ncbi:pentatricopeptide repeat-containing protein At4g21065-like [Magnolia sinica]|uniref:pentatricopeptide repeat-containing protein At4g21065-like n=1 Tax=Magnolia sinica TaxID=86752 RepID=UPI002659F1CB|nr:pentatricopeptide repeat-containing protein At4g21065-like [Magnolia sinica]